MTSNLASQSSASTVAALQPDDWLSNVCQRTVYRINGANQAAESEVADRLAEELSRVGAEFTYAKVDTRRVSEASALQSIGFRTVDVNLTLVRSPDSPPVKTVGRVEVVPVPCDTSLDAEHHPLAIIAGQCFRFSRFHLDPSFPDDVANRIKRYWIANYIRGGRGDRLWAAKVEGRYAGFLAAVTIPARRVAAIDLIGVAEPYQGRGVGRALISAFAEHYRTASERLVVGTQAANAPSLRLYQKCGFFFDQSAYVLHRHGRQTGNNG